MPYLALDVLLQIGRPVTDRATADPDEGNAGTSPPVPFKKSFAYSEVLGGFRCGEKAVAHSHTPVLGRYDVSFDLTPACWNAFGG